jgi:hypothetical protein
VGIERTERKAEPEPEAWVFNPNIQSKVIYNAKLIYTRQVKNAATH